VPNACEPYFNYTRHYICVLVLMFSYEAFLLLHCSVTCLFNLPPTGGILAGVISDYLGGRALTCSVMLLLAAPCVSVPVFLNISVITDFDRIY
jgi:hypothetical protein